MQGTLPGDSSEGSRGAKLSVNRYAAGPELAWPCTVCRSGDSRRRVPVSPLPKALAEHDTLLGDR